MDELTPFSTLLIVEPDFNQADFEAECRRLIDRQKAIAGLLDGTTSGEDLLELLDDHGIDPSGWIDMAFDNLAYLGFSCV